MKNLRSILTVGMVVGGLFSGIIIRNSMTYNFVKNEISKAKTAEHANFYCKMVLKDSYNYSRIQKIIDGGDDAARDYLELAELNKK